MNRVVAAFCVAVFTYALVAVAEDAEAKDGEARERIGVYDSRAVAVAFGGSEPFNKWMEPLTKGMEKAKADKDTRKIAEIEAEAAARQKAMHKQAFSTAPVDNILDLIKDLLPAIREKAGVTELVSKWDKAGLAKHPEAEQVDVTMDLVDAFKPSDRQRKSAIAVMKTDPVPLEQAGKVRE